MDAAVDGLGERTSDYNVFMADVFANSKLSTLAMSFASGSHHARRLLMSAGDSDSNDASLPILVFQQH